MHFLSEAHKLKSHNWTSISLLVLRAETTAQISMKFNTYVYTTT